MMHRTAWAALSVLLVLCACSKEKEKQTGAPPPPPPPETTGGRAGACASGGAELKDAQTSGIFPRQTAGYCIDSQVEPRVYGEKEKLSLDDVCTTAFDGECEVYKRFGLVRVVSLRYVDGSGKGGTVDVNLSKFADVGGAYGMFTTRVIADADPARDDASKPLEAGGGGALGTGTAYVWKGPYLAELSYINETETPEQMAKSGASVLAALGKEMGAKIPGSLDKPAPARALPAANMLPNGIRYYPKDVMGWSGAGAGAVGFYKEGDKRYRVVSLSRETADAARDAFKVARTRPGAAPVASLGEEAVHFVSGEAKVESVMARKGTTVLAITDEDLVADAKARVSKEEKTNKVRALLGDPAAKPAR